MAFLDLLKQMGVVNQASQMGNTVNQAPVQAQTRGVFNNQAQIFPNPEEAQKWVQYLRGKEEEESLPAYPGFIPSFKGYGQKILQDPSLLPGLTFAGVTHAGLSFPEKIDNLLMNLRTRLLLEEVERRRLEMMGGPLSFRQA